jgi:hypothetical protein
MTNGAEYTCPLSPVDRRLEDVHRQWHEAEKLYFDPDGFRVAIQAAIGTLRSVTFVLQYNKRLIPNFDEWYEGWRQKLADDPLMRWLVDARNKIEKRGDLEANSFVKAEIIASYLDEGPVVEVPAQLFDRPWELIKNIPDGAVGDHVRKNGTLRIERRWVENTLPEYELLEAVAIGYGRISELVRDAHRQMGLDCPVTTDTESGERYDEGAREGRLPCMIGHEHDRALMVSLVDGIPLKLRDEKKALDAEQARIAKERYGDIHDNTFASLGAPEVEQVKVLFETAKKVFLKDGYHLPMLFLLRDRRLVQMVNTQAEDHGQKYLIMRAVAEQVTTYGADCVISLGEVWGAPVTSLKPYERPEDSPERQELLIATLATKTGAALELSALIQRDGDKLELGETQVNEEPVLMFLAPVLKAWGLEVPKEWIDTAVKATS